MYSNSLSSQLSLSETSIKRISEANKGKVSWMKGPTTEDSRVQKLIEKSVATRKRLYIKGKLKPWNLGKSWSEEMKMKLSTQRKGKTYETIMGPEKAILFKKRLSELGKRFCGESNPMYRRKGNLNPHYGLPAKHGKHSFRNDLGHHCRSKWEANYARYLL